MLVLFDQMGEELGDLLVESVNLLLVAQHGADAENELGNSGVGSIPRTILRLALRRIIRGCQVSGKFVGDLTPAALRRSQTVFPYEFAFNDGSGPCCCFT